jgi:cytochrome c
MTYVGLSLLVGIWVALFAHYGSVVLYHTGEIEEAAYPLIITEEATPADEAAPEEQPEAGAKVSKKCAACHSFDKDGKNKVGPNLWDIVGKAIAGGEGYKYSGALAELGGEWTYDSLDAFLTKPKDFAAGTKMSFAGLKKAEDRANLIAFLRSRSDDPKPLP